LVGCWGGLGFEMLGWYGGGKKVGGVAGWMEGEQVEGWEEGGQVGGRFTNIFETNITKTGEKIFFRTNKYLF